MILYQNVKVMWFHLIKVDSERDGRPADGAAALHLKVLIRLSEETLKTSLQLNAS